MVLSVPVVTGQQILQAQLAEPVTQDLSFRIKPGMRAVTLSIDRENAVGGAIKEGDRVDVIATINADEFQQATLPLGAAITPTEAARLAALTGLDLKTVFSSMSITILQQAEVLAVDALSASTTPTTQGEASTGVFSSGSSSTASKRGAPGRPGHHPHGHPGRRREASSTPRDTARCRFTLVPAQDTTKVTTAA